MRLIEILAVVAAFAFLGYTGFLAVRRLAALSREIKRVKRETQPRVDVLLAGADTAQRRVLSITATREYLLERLSRLVVSLHKTRILLRAAKESGKPVSRLLGYLGM